MLFDFQSLTEKMVCNNQKIKFFFEEKLQIMFEKKLFGLGHEKTVLDRKITRFCGSKKPR